MTDNTTISCRKCGSTFNRDANYCENCGTELPSSKEKTHSQTQNFDQSKPATISNAETTFVAPKLRDIEIDLDQEFEYYWDIGAGALKTTNERQFIKIDLFNDEDLENPDTVSYAVTGPNDEPILRIDREGLVNADYSVYDVASSEPVAVFEKKNMSISNRTWQVRDPDSDEVTHKLTSDSVVRELLHFGSPTGLFFQPSVSITVRNNQGKMIFKETYPDNFLIFFGADCASSYVIGSPNAVDIICALVLLIHEREN